MTSRMTMARSFQLDAALLTEPFDDCRKPAIAGSELE